MIFLSGFMSVEMVLNVHIACHNSLENLWKLLEPGDSEVQIGVTMSHLSACYSTCKSTEKMNLK